MEPIDMIIVKFRPDRVASRSAVSRKHYQIRDKIITTRLKAVTHQIISDNQFSLLYAFITQNSNAEPERLLFKFLKLTLRSDQLDNLYHNLVQLHVLLYQKCVIDYNLEYPIQYDCIDYSVL